MQVARNLTDQFSGFLMGKSHLILDRDTKYTAQFRRLIAESRTAVIRLPPRSPNLNAYAERFVRSIKEECLDRMIFVGQASLRRAIAEFVVHYHGERNHQGLGNRLIQPGQQIFGGGRVSLSTSAPRWNAQLLSSSGRVTVGRDFGYYAQGPTSCRSAVGCRRLFGPGIPGRHNLFVHPGPGNLPICLHPFRRIPEVHYAAAIKDQTGVA